MSSSFIRLLTLVLACCALIASSAFAHPSHTSGSPEYRLYLDHHTKPYYPKYFHKASQTCHASHLGKIYHGELSRDKCYFFARDERFSATNYEVIKH